MLCKIRGIHGGDYEEWHHVALVRTEVSKKLSASIIRVTRIGELGTTLAVTSNRRTLRINVLNVLIRTIKFVTEEYAPGEISSMGKYSWNFQCLWQSVICEYAAEETQLLIGCPCST
jgi:hypothetical protein